MDQTKRRLRERQLAGDGRAGSWTRSKARQEHWEFIKRGWRYIATALAAMAVVSTAVVLVLPNHFVQGLFLGGVCASTLSAFAMLVIQATGTTSRSMGATAEQWTASELRVLRKHGWKVVNHLALHLWDIDHVAVGRGGVFAVESKWSARGWSLDRSDQHLRRALDQVKGNARNLRLWHDFKSEGVTEVQPVLFLWGGASTTKPPEPVSIDGVLVVYGLKAARRWRETLLSKADAGLDAGVINRLWDALNRRVVVRDERELADHPPLPSLQRLYWTGLGLVLLALGSFLLSAAAAAWTDAKWTWAAGMVAAAIVPLVLGRRYNRLRPFVASWQIGLLVAVVRLITWLVPSL